MRLKRIRKRFPSLLQSAGASYYESKISMKQLKVDFSKPCAWSYIYIYLFFNSSKFDRENNYVYRRRKILKVLKIYVHRYIIRNNQPRCLLYDIMSSETETNGEKERKIKNRRSFVVKQNRHTRVFFDIASIAYVYYYVHHETYYVKSWKYSCSAHIRMVHNIIYDIVIQIVIRRFICTHLKSLQRILL